MCIIFFARNFEYLVEYPWINTRPALEGREGRRVREKGMASHMRSVKMSSGEEPILSEIQRQARKRACWISILPAFPFFYRVPSINRAYYSCSYLQVQWHYSSTADVYSHGCNAQSHNAFNWISMWVCLGCHLWTLPKATDRRPRRRDKTLEDEPPRTGPSDLAEGINAKRLPAKLRRRDARGNKALWRPEAQSLKSKIARTQGEPPAAAEPRSRRGTTAGVGQGQRLSFRPLRCKCT